jgi:hypothetical protein
LRKAYSTPEVQTPWKYGGESRNFQIADLSEILKQHNAVKPGYSQLKKTLLRDVTSIDIRSLGGFKKGFHHEPDHVSSATQDFVVSKSKDEIETEMNEVPYPYLPADDPLATPEPRPRDTIPPRPALVPELAE